MKHTIKHLTILLMLALLSAPLSSCGGDEEDEPIHSDPEAIYDFSIVWEVVDAGEYTTSEANVIAAEFTIISQDVFEAVTEQGAVKLFNDFCQEMRYEFATGYKEITLVAKLVRNEGAKVVARKTFYINPDGTTIKAPQRSSVQVVTIE